MEKFHFNNLGLDKNKIAIDPKYFNHSHITIDVPKPYEIDFDKVNTLEDVTNILKGLGFVIWVSENQKPVGYEYIKDYLIEKPKDFRRNM